MKQTMLCAQCSTRCTWPDDFPNSTYAICRPCVNIEEDEKRASFSFIVAGAVLIGVLLVLGAIVYFFAET